MDMALVAPESASIQRPVKDGRVSREALASAENQSTARGRSDVVGSFGRGRDWVDVSGLDAIGEAIKQYRGKEAMPIPESVGKAIRSLVREVFDGLPNGGAYVA
ncbi:MAG: hypothetical protein HQL94_04850 [Magnetococcales bacterium]|nr:hypothetical protein [Magnetococcales bacterium]MBF0439267.1 hypothetical protein [Magnetococcales bacterium]